MIATGAHPSIPNIPGAELGGSSDDVFAWEEVPESVAILGAGYIAVELAGVLYIFGVKTDLFVRCDCPLCGLIPTSLKVWSKEMERINLPLHTHKVPAKLEKTDDGISIHFEDGTSHTASLVIWATGRRPNVKCLQLEKAGVTLNGRGFIQVDEYQNTVVEGIYALGDGTFYKELTQVAMKDEYTLSERSLQRKKQLQKWITQLFQLLSFHTLLSELFGLTGRASYYRIAGMTK